MAHGGMHISSGRRGAFGVGNCYASVHRLGPYINQTHPGCHGYGGPWGRPLWYDKAITKWGTRYTDRDWDGSLVKRSRSPQTILHMAVGKPVFIISKDEASY